MFGDQQFQWKAVLHIWNKQCSHCKIFLLCVSVTQEYWWYLKFDLKPIVFKSWRLLRKDSNFSNILFAKVQHLEIRFYGSWPGGFSWELGGMIDGHETRHQEEHQHHVFHHFLCSCVDFKFSLLSLYFIIIFNSCESQKWHCFL